MTDKVEHVTLPDGRKMDYRIAGDPNGFPMFFIHGTPGAFITPVGIPELCKSKGVMCVSMTRAGYGGSTRSKGRKVVDCVPDLEALKKHLGINECVVAGWSGGGPHTLACAARLPGCLGALSVAGVAPHDAEGLDWIAGQGEDNVHEYHISLKGEPAMAEFSVGMRKEMLQVDAKGVVDSMSSLLPDVDKKAIESQPDVGQNIVDSFQEAFRVSADGYVDDSIQFVEPWGFGLDEIKVPVFLWQGSDDLMVPYSHGQWLGKHLPQDKVVKHLVEGQGHVSIFFGNQDAMLDELLSVRTK